MATGAWRSASAGSGPLGDVNCDSSVNSIDAALILQLDAGLTALLPCEEKGDVNGDTMANALDATLILQFAAGLLGSLEPPASPTAPSASATPEPQPTPAFIDFEGTHSGGGAVRLAVSSEILTDQFDVSEVHVFWADGLCTSTSVFVPEGAKWRIFPVPLTYPYFEGGNLLLSVRGAFVLPDDLLGPPNEAKGELTYTWYDPFSGSRPDLCQESYSWSASLVE